MLHFKHLAMPLMLVLVIAFLLVGIAPTHAAGTISLTTFGSAYTQNFNTLATSGTTNTTLPTGWELNESGSSARNNSAYAASTGSDNAGDVYSFGASGNSERAYGTLRSGTLSPIIGASFTNNTPGKITSLAIAYTGEMWRAGVLNRNAADRLDFQISTNATSLTTGTWVDVDALDLNSPNINASTNTLDGNAAGNRATINFTIAGLDIANGATFWIRWNDFDITSSDDGLAIDDFSLTANGTIADSAPLVASTNPASGAIGVTANANIVVTFSEPVNVTGTWFTITCTSGARTAIVSGGATTFTLDPTTDFANGDVCTLTIVAAQVSDQDANDPPDVMVANFIATFTSVNVCTLPFTAIPAIQGSGAATAITGTVTTQGVVIGDYEGASPTLRGFYIQDPGGDGNAATSDGIFVFNGNTNSVVLGQLVRVTGTAAEFQDQTQITASAITQCGTGSVAPTDVTLPFASANFPERYEGMLVRLPQTLYVTEHFQLGRFDQVVMSSGARLKQPTNVVAPGAPALALQATNNLNRIIIDDALNNQNPDPILFGRGGNPLSASNTLRGGDTATGIVGVMTYTWAGNAASGNAYRVRPINALNGAVNFVTVNARPGSPSAVGGTLRVAAMNLLNYFNTFDGLPDTVDNCANGVGGAATDCRGADTQAEFDRQSPKTIAAIIATGADVIGVNEIENDGYGPASALQDLVTKLNAVTAPGTYAFVDVDARTGQTNALGTDAIKVGLLYKPGKVSLIGQTAALNSVAFVNGGDGAPRNRPALAQAFQQNSNGARFIVNVNHLKSKGSACDAPDAGDGQGNCNIVRRIAASALIAWLAGNPTGINDPDVLILGDLNSYALEDPVTVIKNGGYTNLVHQFLNTGAYSYVFDGQWGYLDHALGSATLTSQVTGVTVYHINADEPSVLDYNTDFKTANLQATLYAPDQYRVSDHDPVIVGLNLDGTPPTLNVSVSPNTLWPPNHKSVTVRATVTVSDNFDPNPTWTLVAVVSNEPDNGLGDGDTPDDIVIVNNTTFQLRAERSGTGAGRVYTLTFKAMDAYGNSTTKSVTVTVPLNQGN